MRLTKYQINLIRNLKGVSIGKIVAKYIGCNQITVFDIWNDKRHKDVPFELIDTSTINIKRDNIMGRKYDFKTINAIRQLRGKMGFEEFKKLIGITPSNYYSILRGEIYTYVPEIKINENEYISYFKSPHIYDIKKCQEEYLRDFNFMCDEGKSGVYVIQNIVNGKVYIGSSINIRTRLMHHMNLLLNGKHSNLKLQRSFNKHGIDNFVFKGLINCPEEYNTKLEQKIKDNPIINSWYNIAADCKAPARGTSMMQESRDKISKKKLGIKLSKKHRDKLSKIKKDRIANDPSYKIKLYSNLGEVRVGEKSGVSKLSDEDRLKIINMINDGIRNKDIAEKYNISSSMITEIKSGRAWKHIQHLISIRSNPI